jgi:hypothetical protein
MSQTSAPLTTYEFQSLMRIANARQSSSPSACPSREAAGGGYIHKGLVGRVLSDLGARLLAGEMGKKDPYEQTSTAR